MCQAVCVNGRFFPCAAGILGGGKVGILSLDFHFSTAHRFSSSLSVSAETTGFFSRSSCERVSFEHAPARGIPTLEQNLFDTPLYSCPTPGRLAGRGLTAESQT